MTQDEQVHPDLERLLELAFPDDLPMDAEEMMGKRLDLFRHRWTEVGRQETLSSIRPGRGAAALVRISLAAVSVLFIILGLRLRAPSPQTDMGSSLASLRGAAFYSAGLMDFQPLKCEVRLHRPENPAQQLTIEWLSPLETRVRIFKAGREIVRTVHPPKPKESVLELIAASGPAEVASPPPLEADLRPVAGLLSSAELRRLLDGRWEPAGTERKDDCNWSTFTVDSAPEDFPSRVTVDTCTSLPVRLEKSTRSGERIEVHFRWAPQRETRRGLIFPRSVSRSAAGTTPS